VGQWLLLKAFVAVCKGWSLFEGAGADMGIHCC